MLNLLPNQPPEDLSYRLAQAAADAERLGISETERWAWVVISAGSFALGVLLAWGFS
jgi:hypothetical protein